MLGRSVPACVLVMGLLAVVNGQQAGDQARQPPVFRTGTNLVRVDVSVMDKDGRPVRSLTADDFELRENGQLQAITSFKLVDATGQPTDDLSLPIRSPEHAAAEAARDDVRVFLIFWDEYHIDQFGSAVRAREQLTRFVLESFGPTDLVGLMDQLTPVASLRFSRDRRALADQVHQLRGRRGVYVPARSAIEEAHLRNAQDVERIRSQVTASALKSAVMHLGMLRQGRKAVVFVSEGLGRLGQDGVRVVSDLIRTANDNNTAIYTVDPRGLQAGAGSFVGMASLLAALADSTGAEPIVSNDMTSALRKIVAHASAFYLLGYSPKDGQLDGKFREIKVKVRQSGVEVRARNGYWAPRGSEVERARAIAAAAALPSPVANAFRELTPDNSRRAADFWIGLSPQSETAVDVKVAWTPRPGPESRPSAAAVTIVAMRGEDRLFEGPVNDDGVSFKAAPGPLQVDFTIHDSAGEVIDREQREVEIPSPAKTLGLATPVVSRARNAAELRALAAEPVPIPYAGREFSRTDRVLVRVFPYGSASANASVTAQLLGRRGDTLAELPIRRSTKGGYQLDLPLTNLAAGEFVVAISARTTEDSVETYLPIRVGRNTP
ncbi:MAG: VWA domain-containing protein [Vicinamibacterales bacterium]